MSNKMKLIAAAITIFALSDIAGAAGFGLYEYSARGNAMGGAVMANKAEPASIATNPALITQLEGNQLQIGLTAVFPEAKTSVNGEQQALRDTAFYLPHLYYTHQISDDVFLGLGAFSRFGLGGEYRNKDDWSGSAMAYKVNLTTFSLNPNLAVKLCDDLSVAMGLEFMILDFNEKKYFNNPGLGGDNTFDLNGDSTTWGGNFGMVYRPEALDKKWAAALTYRTKVRHVATGDIKSAGAAFGPLAGDATAALTLPDQIAFGLSYDLTEDLTLEADILGVFWSSYENLRVDYKTNPIKVANEEKKYRDVYRINLGAEYSVNKNWDVRAGYVFDKSPINPNYMDTLVPVDDRNIFNVGVGYKKDRYAVDFAYSLLLGKDLKGTGGHPLLGDVDVEYKDGKSHMFALSFRYTL